MENRDVAFSGHTASGMIETHDAWVTPWYLEQQKDQELAKPKGGPYFAVFNGDFKELRLSTALPGLRQPRLASRGQQVLLSGSAVPLETAYGLDLPPLLRNPVQDHFGGGETDAYLLLIRVGDQ